MKIDWKSLSSELDCEMRGGSDLAKLAVTSLLGPDWIPDAIEHYIDGGPGSELARSVLWMLRPQQARDYCISVYEGDSDIDRRRMAVELLRVVAAEETLPMVSRFLADSDSGIQAWGAGVLDQLLWSELVEPESCTDILTSMQSHPNEAVVERFEFISGFLASRKKQNEEANRDP